jgi:hypothetical protein
MQQDTMSPRIVALQLLHILHRYLEPRQRFEMMKELKPEFETVVDEQLEESAPESVEYALVVAILEAQSGAATNIVEGGQTSRQAFNNSRFLQRALSTWPKGHIEVESAVLKLSINTTNTEAGAEVFGHQALLRSLTRCTCDGVHKVQEAVDNGRLQDHGHVYDGLLLILGVMINILEQYAPARGSMDDRSLDNLSTLYLENHESLRDVS